MPYIQNPFGDQVRDRDFNISAFANLLKDAIAAPQGFGYVLKEPEKLYIDGAALKTASSQDLASGAFAQAKHIFDREMAEFISEGYGVYNQQGYITEQMIAAINAEVRESDEESDASVGAGQRGGGVPWEGSPAGGAASSGGGAGGGQGGAGGQGGGGAAGGGGGGGTGGGASTNGAGIPVVPPRAAEFVQGGEGLAIGAASHRVSGPMEVARENDKHQIGTDRDGNPINSLHLNTLTYFWRNADEDAPIEFDTTPWVEPDHAKFLVYTYLRYDVRRDHPFVLGNRAGLWRFESQCHQAYVPGIPPEHPPDVHPQPHPFSPVRSWFTGGPPEIPVGMTNVHIIPGTVYRPQPLGSGWAEMRNTMVDHPDDIRRLNAEAPIVARVESYVAGIGDSFNYNERPGFSRYQGGTAHGGLAYLPPELDIADYDSSFAPAGRPTSTSHHVALPGVYWAAGYPDVATGGMKTGFRWSGDTAGELTYQRVNASGTATDVLAMTQEGALVTKYLGSDPTTPDSGYVGIFTKSDGLYYVLDDGTIVGPLVDSVAGGGAPTGAEYLVSAAHAGLSAERVTTDTATVTWDHSVAGQAKANVPDDGITDAKLRDSAAVSVIGRSANSAGSPADIAAAANDRVLSRTGDAIGFTQLTAGMAPSNVWTYAKIQQVSATDRFLGRKTAGAGDIEELTGTEATARLDAFTAALKGLVPASGGGTTNFLRADGTWAAPGGGGTHNLLDGSTHPDTVAQTVTRGSLIYGNSTPAWDELPLGSAHQYLKSDGTDVEWENGHPALVCKYYESLTKTNIGSSYVDIYTTGTAFHQTRLDRVDFTNVKDVRLVFSWDYVGVGTQSVRIVDRDNNTNVLVESSGFTTDQDPGDTGWVTKPGWAAGVFNLEFQGKSTTAGDDPISKGYALYVR